jgi:2-dehydro-3-deoxyphosphogluconate aldolase/(4S)-4-hydroxy-2-oxoglutarate aldolase
MEAVLAQRVVAVVRSPDARTALANARAALDAGIRTLEIALTTPGTLDVVTALVAEDRDAIIGVGTVLDIGDARDALDAGATFLVCPHTDPGLVAFAVEREVPILPGAGTVTEIITALRAGAKAVKIFPAAAIGTSFVRDALGPLPDALLVPTGGVTVQSAPDWLAAGAAAVGLGSGLTKGTPDDVASRVAALLALL